MLLVSQVVLWVVVIGLAVTVLALARQVGVLHERIAPVGALALGRGPQTGESAPQLTAHTLAGGTVEIGGPQPAGALRLLFFVSPTCPICKSLLPTVKAFTQSERLEMLLIGDGDVDQQRQMAERHGIELERCANAPEVGRAFQVAKLPYAVLIDTTGVIVAQGLVNSREHLESLVTAHELGLRSVQEYLAERASRSAGAAPG
ncbi:MAG TPA: methylamine dehydrogenase accessory protein MauD [Steroidobacteraceae bacterium]|nr:methylamine dehydrogenase accessory protein MauD [Steroidobacteraceae bacterium]